MLLEDHSAEKQGQKLSINHKRLLYLLSCFAISPKSTDEEEHWLRNLPLLVLVYEAIVNGVLEYDYSPVCTNILKEGKSRRIWMNVSQEARSAIDDLRDYGFVHALKTCSEDFQPSIAFQVTPISKELLRSLSNSEKTLVDQFLSSSKGTPHLQYSGSTYTIFSSEYLQISFDIDDGKFRIHRNDGSVVESRVTEVEDVSYVSSPYLPSCLMRTQAAFSSNSTLAYKSGHGTNGIQDELSCSISLSKVRVMVGEWIPFGPNQIVTLNERLGSLNRCQGGLFTSEIDTFPTSTCLNINPGLTKIAIVDFDFASFTNLEADIQWPEQDGIVQIESFGMHIDGNGTIVYGMNVEAIMDKSADSIFVDHLSRLLVDVHSDSSKIINDLLSSHQRQLLDMLFMEDAVSRSKYSLITGKKITPKLPAKKYLDKSEMENELKQVLGEIISTHDLSEDDIIIIGQDGMLLLGPNCDRHEGLMIAYLTLLSHDLLIRCLFKKTFMLDEILNRARIYLRHYEKNPNALNTTRARLNQCSHDLILLEEVLELLRDAMESFNLPKCPPDDEGKRLFYHLKLSKMLSDLDIRCRDLVKILRGFRAKLKQVQSQNSNMAKTILETAVRGVDKNFGVVSEHRKKHESIMQHSFDFLLFLFGCTLSFDALDRLTNGITLGSSILSKNNGDYPMTWANNFIYDGILTHPLLWFVLNILWVCACILCVRKLLQYIYQKKEDLRIDSFKVNEKVNVNALENLLSSFNIKTETCTIGIETRIIKAEWTIEDKHNIQKWSGMEFVERINICYDSINSYLLNVTFKWRTNLEYPQRNSLDLYESFIKTLHRGGCFDGNFTSPRIEKMSKVEGLKTRIRKSVSKLTTTSIYPTW